MKNAKYRPMTVIGFSALALMFAAITADKAFLCGAVAFCLGAVLTAVILISGKLHSLTTLAFICSALILSGALLVSYDVYTLRPAQKYYGNSAYVTGTIGDKSVKSDNFDGYILNIETVGGEKLNASMMLYLASDADFAPGNTVGFKADLEKAFSGDELSSVLYLKSNNILFSAFVADDGNIEVLSDSAGGIKGAVYKVRSYIKSAICERLPGDTGALAEAMLLGDKTDLSDHAKSSFTLTGVSHLFAVSGLHLSVWVLSIYELLRKIRLNRYINAVLADVFIVLFMALTGFTPSVCRAGIMLLTVMTGRLFSAQSDPYNSLGLACVILLIAKPYSAVSVSLLLSLSATLGIVSLFPFIYRQIFTRLEKKTPYSVRVVLKTVISLILITFCAVIFTLPVSAFITGYISLLAPVTNLLVSFAATVCMISAGICAVFFSIGFISFPAAFICGVCSKYILSVTGALSQSPVTVVDLNSVFVKYAVVVFVSGVVIIFTLTEQNRNRVKAVLALLLCVVVIACSSFFIYCNNRTEIDIFSVGDGICASARSGANSMAIGCGGSDYYSSSELAQSLGINADLLIIPDENRWNSGSVKYLLSKCRFKNVVAGYDSFGIDTMFENTVHSDFFNLNPWDSASVEFCNKNGNCFAYCVFGSNDILFIFSSNEDFSLPEEYERAQTLVLSYYPPENLDISKFDNIILSSSDEIKESIEYENPDVSFLCTSDYEKITLDYKSGNLKIKCQGR
ncbi:MAG: ComEC/Rec2 family competence protein [Clostridia bacterium]|nr:ComEC/Rec2 family competence protein [Clostridia bacterium]